MEVLIIKAKTLSYNSNVKIRIGIIFFCFIAALLSQSVNLNIPVLIVFVAYCLLMLVGNAFFLIKYFMFVLGIGMAVISEFIIESKPIYLRELVCTSKYSGALPLFVAYFLVFMLTLELSDRNYSISNNYKELNANIISFNGKPITGFVLDVLGTVLFVFIVIMFLRLVIFTKPYFILDIDRFAFRKLYVEGFWKSAENYYIYFMPIFIMNWMRGKKKVPSLTVLIYILYQIWEGEKYTGLIIIMYLIILPFLSELNEDTKKKISKLLVKSCAIVLVLVVIVLVQYSLTSSQGVFEAFSDRLAMQGELWWSIYTRQANQLSHINEFADELAAFSKDSNLNPYYGIYKIMYLCAPADVVTAKLARGSRYTESTAASIYYYFGKELGPFVLIIFAIVIGLCFAFLSKIYTKFISERCIVESIIITRLIVVFRELFHMSDIKAVLEIPTLITIVILLVCVYIRQKRMKKVDISYKKLVLNKGR